MEPIFFESADQFRQWLATHHATETEVLVDRVVPLRANPGPQEHALINQFNLSLVENPIPVA